MPNKSSNKAARPLYASPQLVHSTDKSDARNKKKRKSFVGRLISWRPGKSSKKVQNVVGVSVTEAEPSKEQANGSNTQLQDNCHNTSPSGMPISVSICVTVNVCLGTNYVPVDGCMCLVPESHHFLLSDGSFTTFAPLPNGQSPQPLRPSSDIN